MCRKKVNKAQQVIIGYSVRHSRLQPKFESFLAIFHVACYEYS